MSRRDEEEWDEDVEDDDEDEDEEDWEADVPVLQRAAQGRGGASGLGPGAVAANQNGGVWG